MRFYYTIYGLQISSNKKLDLLRESAASEQIDIEFIWGEEQERPYTDAKWVREMNDGLKNRQQLHVYTTWIDEVSVTQLHYRIDGGTTTYYMRPDRKEIQVIYDETVPEHDVQSMFSGPVMGAILRLKGIVCLHASVVNIDGCGVAFIGTKEAGKSTMAANFGQEGYEVLADDVGAIVKKNELYYIEPGYPKVRLRPLALTAMHGNEKDSFPQVYSHRNSRYANIDDKFCHTSLPLGAIYVLVKSDNIGDTPKFVAVEDAEKYVQICSNMFASYVLDKKLRMQEFMFLGELAANIPVRKIMLEHNLDNLKLQCQSVVQDFRAITQQ